MQSTARDWLHSFSKLDRSRFVRQDRSSPVIKNAQIFLVVKRLVIVGVVILFSSATPSFKSKLTTPAAQMGMAKSDFSRMHRSRLDLISL